MQDCPAVEHDLKCKCGVLVVLHAMNSIFEAVMSSFIQLAMKCVGLCRHTNIHRVCA